MDANSVFVIAIISAVVTLVTLVLTIVGSVWLNRRSNERISESLKTN